MTENFIGEIRKLNGFSRAIVTSVTLFRDEKRVEIKIVTDRTFSEDDRQAAEKIARGLVPEYFSCGVKISKLTPDGAMVRKKILELIAEINRPMAAFVGENDVKTENTDDGFYFEISVMHASSFSANFADKIAEELKKCFCGEFRGKCVTSAGKIEDLVIEEPHENVEYIIPVRTFDISGFTFLEGSEVLKKAVYISDLNFTSENVVICGRLEDIRERTITKQNGKEKVMYNFTVNDSTASVRVGYFTRQKSIDKIKRLKVGDSVVLTCRTEIFNGMIRPTAIFVDYGTPPENFVPEKRRSKPVPKYYEHVFPEPYEGYEQANFFVDTSLPKCLTDNVFVVFDLETTGLNSSPSSGNMDGIIEIGAYKIIGGEIKEQFSTFVNPARKLSAEIISLTGIDQKTVDAAPTYEKVMPDFFKFCDGAYLVGHNAANFDFKFIDYYCSQCGYMPERKLFDTLPLSQRILQLPNYKLNTVADHFGITFNHHRAVDDALVTAKIFIELIKLKKILPTPC